MRLTRQLSHKDCLSVVFFNASSTETNASSTEARWQEYVVQMALDAIEMG